MSHPFRFDTLPISEGPLYRRLQALIREAVGDGRLRPAEALPSERDLATDLNVSRVTVRKALEGLVAEGVVEQRHGSGTFVADRGPRLEQGLSHLTSFSEDMRIRGRRTTSDWLLRGLDRVQTAEAMALAVSPGTFVSRFHRRRRADGVPLAVERACVPASILPDPAVVEDSLYAAMEAAGRRPVRALQHLSAENVGEADAELLGVAPGTAALAILRVSFDADGRPVERTHSFYRGDAYDFVAELTLSQGHRSR
ncbi:GntR family transcriptional regulator [Aureimonas mangrovi]|uniref:GntR family transcriptional regulator n=1 Tax=Aureimonas mangrovi TaxID=2758041 RepID=UPI00163D7676|nr:GntR family transcriptional regulator [Aureimonas mangrovi]